MGALYTKYKRERHTHHSGRVGRTSTRYSSLFNLVIGARSRFKLQLQPSTLESLLLPEMEVRIRCISKRNDNNEESLVCVWSMRSYPSVPFRTLSFCTATAGHKVGQPSPGPLNLLIRVTTGILFHFSANLRPYVRPYKT